MITAREIESAEAELTSALKQDAWDYLDHDPVDPELGKKLTLFGSAPRTFQLLDITLKIQVPRLAVREKRKVVKTHSFSSLMIRPFSRQLTEEIQVFWDERKEEYKIDEPQESAQPLDPSRILSCFMILIEGLFFSRLRKNAETVCFKASRYCEQHLWLKPVFPENFYRRNMNLWFLLLSEAKSAQNLSDSTGYRQFPPVSGSA